MPLQCTYFWCFGALVIQEHVKTAFTQSSQSTPSRGAEAEQQPTPLVNRQGYPPEQSNQGRGPSPGQGQYPSQQPGHNSNFGGYNPGRGQPGIGFEHLDPNYPGQGQRPLDPNNLGGTEGAFDEGDTVFDDERIQYNTPNRQGCDVKPCMNSAKCKDATTEHPDGSGYYFRCKCPKYFTGYTCESPTFSETCEDSCSSNKRRRCMQYDELEKLVEKVKKPYDKQALEDVFKYKSDKVCYCIAPGTKGPMCSSACDKKHYGQNCLFSCQRCRTHACKSTSTGTCRRCKDGWEGSTCDKEQECTPKTCKRGFCLPRQSNDVADLLTNGLGEVKKGLTVAQQRAVQEMAELNNHSLIQKCVCDGGYRGVYCNKKCPRTSWGFMCQNECGHCRWWVKQRPQCNQKTGHCKKCSKPIYSLPLCLKSVSSDSLISESQAGPSAAASTSEFSLTAVYQATTDESQAALRTILNFISTSEANILNVKQSADPDQQQAVETLQDISQVARNHVLKSLTETYGDTKVKVLSMAVSKPDPSGRKRSAQAKLVRMSSSWVAYSGKRSDLANHDWLTRVNESRFSGKFESSDIEARRSKRQAAQDTSPTPGLQVDFTVKLPPAVASRAGIEDDLISTVRKSADTFQTEALPGLGLDKDSISAKRAVVRKATTNRGRSSHLAFFTFVGIVPIVIGIFVSVWIIKIRPKKTARQQVAVAGYPRPAGGGQSDWWQPYYTVNRSSRAATTYHSSRHAAHSRAHELKSPHVLPDKPHAAGLTQKSSQKVKK